MRLTGICKLVFLAIALAGCATSQPLSTQKVAIGTEVVTYVFCSYDNTMGVDVTICDRYDSQGHLLAHDAASATGTVHAALQSIPAAAATSTVAGAVMGAVLPTTTTTTKVSVSK